MNMELPNWLAIVQAENRIFVDKRAGIAPEDRWTAYANAAQVVLGFAQDLEEDELEGMFDLKSATPVIAAARILDATAAVHLRSWRETGSPEASEMALSSTALV